jgi:hypothetical protein
MFDRLLHLTLQHLAALTAAFSANSQPTAEAPTTQHPAMWPGLAMNVAPAQCSSQQGLQERCNCLQEQRC